MNKLTEQVAMSEAKAFVIYEATITPAWEVFNEATKADRERLEAIIIPAWHIYAKSLVNT